MTDKQRREAAKVAAQTTPTTLPSDVSSEPVGVTEGANPGTNPIDLSTLSYDQLIAFAKQKKEAEVNPLWDAYYAAEEPFKKAVLALKAAGESVNLYSLFIEVTQDDIDKVLIAIKANTGKPYNMTQLAKAAGYADATNGVFKEVIANLDGDKITVADAGKGKGKGKVITLK